MFGKGDWVKERMSVGQGEIIEVTSNGGGKQVVKYRMATGQTAKQFAEFLEQAERPTDAEIQAQVQA